MDSEQAKAILLLYRGRIDDDDPQFTEAVAQAERDPNLSEWLRQQTESYEAIRSKLREIDPLPFLAQRILHEQPTPSYRGLAMARMLQLAAAIVVLASLTALGMHFFSRKALQQEKEITVRGEVLDMACYIPYHLSGPKHAKCAKDCIRKGLPVGIKAEDGNVYLLIGATKSMNNELAEYAAQIITIRGKASKRDGFALLEIEEIRKS